MSRIQSGHAIAVAPTPVDTPALLADAAEAHAFQAADRQVELECDVTEGTPAVLADHDRVLQVLSNLVGNALKFTPEGGRVRLDAGPDGPDMVRFSVSDTGPGIPAEEIPYVFEPFTQAKDTATLGTGLGLSIARGIVEAHGGTISVESHPGEGAIFRFTLPVAATRAAEGAGEPADGARGAAAP